MDGNERRLPCAVEEALRPLSVGINKPHAEAMGDEDLVLIQVGRRIRELRHRRGMTIGELATDAGLRRPSTSRIEAGLQALSLERVFRVGEAFEGAPASLLLVVYKIQKHK